MAAMIPCTWLTRRIRGDAYSGGAESMQLVESSRRVSKLDRASDLVGRYMLFGMATA